MDEQNKYTVIVSEHAKQMLVSHAAFLAQTSVNAAQRLADSFEKIEARWNLCRKDVHG